VLAPETLHIVLDSRSQRTEIIKAGDTTIDFEGWRDKELALEQVLDFAATVLLGEVFVDGFFGVDFLVVLCGLSCFDHFY